MKEVAQVVNWLSKDKLLDLLMKAAIALSPDNQYVKKPLLKWAGGKIQLLSQFDWLYNFSW